MQIFKKKQKSNNFHNSINPNSLARYVGLIKNFSPVRNNSNKFNIKNNHMKEKSNEQKKILQIIIIFKHLLNLSNIKL